MEKSQWYIGTPSGVVLCVDQTSEGCQFSGRFYHAYSREGTEFSSMEEAIFKLEDFYDSIRFPRPTTNSRTFMQERQETNQEPERIKIMDDEKLLSRHGDIGSFIIRVQHRQNNSWQGRITWMEQDKTVNFRSMWEMLKLIENALDNVSNEDGTSKELSWAGEAKRTMGESDIAP